MARLLHSTFELTDEPMTEGEIRKAFTDFRYFTSHCQQIVDKRRRLVYMRLNRFQDMVFEKLLPMVDPETRIDKRHDVVFLKPRQVGATVGLIDWTNYILSYVEGLENFNVLHTFPATDTVAKIYSQKVEPIITGTHPDIMPTIEKEPAMSSTIRLHYKDILGIRRNNYYDLVSANANSIRSGTANMWIADEVAFYRNPEALEDAISPSLPAYGFSLVVYASTFDDKMSPYFKEKIQIARDNPEDWTLIFAPWFMVYPEEPQGVALDSLTLTEYDQNVIIPAMKEYNLPTELWGDAIDWYHRQSTRTSNMKKEYPTTLDEVLQMGENKCYFAKEDLAYQREYNQEEGTPYRLVTDNLTNKVEAQKTDASPLTIYRSPIYGHRYKLVVDAITSMNDGSDYFAMTMFDDTDLSTVAEFYEKGLSIEDYADYAVGMAKLYGNATICPEKNMAEAFITAVKSRNYYYLYYESDADRKRKLPGIRTTATSKDKMLDTLCLLLSNHKIIIRSKRALDQMETFEKRVKTRADGTKTVRACARAGHHDDLVSNMWIYAGTLNQKQLTGSQGHGWVLL